MRALQVVDVCVYLIKFLYFAFNELLHPDDHAIRDEALALHYKTRLPFKVTYRLKNKGGLYKWYVSTGQASFDETGKPTRMIGAILEHTT